MRSSDLNSNVRARNRRLILVVALMAGGAGIANLAICRAAEPRPYHPKRLEDGFPDVLTFETDTNGHYATAIPDMPRLKEWVHFQIRTADDKVSKYATDLSLTEERRSIPGDTSESVLDFGFSFPGLTVGKVFPLLGYIYEVSDMETGNKHVLTLKRVNDESRLKEIGVQRDSISMPLHAGCGVEVFPLGASKGSGMEVEQITGSRDSGRKLTARLTVTRDVETYPGHFVGDVKHVDLAVGESATPADGYRLTVRRIVPSDKHGVVGWVEFGLSRAESRDR